MCIELEKVWNLHDFDVLKPFFLMFRELGDRVAICSRNYPEYLVAFWASQLIGAVSTFVNAWATLDVVLYCLVHTESKLIIVDAERADQLEPAVKKLVVAAKSTGIIVLESQEGKGTWEGMATWEDALKNFKNDGKYISSLDPGLAPEDDATIFFTSGTTGRPKGVLSTQRQFLTNIPNSLVRSRRAILRRGDQFPPPKSTGPQKGVLISVPLFHVTGLTGLGMMATFGGLKIIFMRRWDTKNATNKERKYHSSWRCTVDGLGPCRQLRRLSPGNVELWRRPSSP